MSTKKFNVYGRQVLVCKHEDEDGIQLKISFSLNCGAQVSVGPTWTNKTPENRAELDRLFSNFDESNAMRLVSAHGSSSPVELIRECMQ